MKIYLILLLSLFLTSCSDTSPSGPKTESPFKFSGDWESSGGDGVVCFESDSALKENQEKLKTTKGLNSITVAYTVESLEHYELFFPGSQEDLKLWSELSNPISYQAVVDKVLQRLNVYVPVFVQKLELALQQIHVDSWYDIDYDISDIPDSDPSREISSRCVMLQLADRRTQSTEGYLPKAKVIFRGDLFAKMSPLNQALLILHEALYLIGKETNHTNSDDIRWVNGMVFSDRLEQFPENMYFSQQARLVQGLFIEYFGDYIRLFMKEEFYNNPQQYADILHRNNFTRSISMIELNQRMRSYIGQCQLQGGDPNLCRDQLMLGLDLKEIINTEEMAFLFLMNYYFDAWGSLFVFSEQLYVLNFEDPGFQDEQIQLQLGAACGMIEAHVTKELPSPLKVSEGILVLDFMDQNVFQRHLEERMWLKDFTLPALLYCKDIRLALRR